jgi:hypothetical protein
MSPTRGSTREKLAQQPASRRAKRQPNGDLAIARGRPREQQIGQVRAGNQQDKADGPEQYEDGPPHVASNQSIAERNDRNRCALIDRVPLDD